MHLYRTTALSIYTASNLDLDGHCLPEGLQRTPNPGRRRHNLIVTEDPPPPNGRLDLSMANRY